MRWGRDFHVRGRSSYVEVENQPPFLRFKSTGLNHTTPGHKSLIQTVPMTLLPWIKKGEIDNLDTLEQALPLDSMEAEEEALALDLDRDSGSRVAIESRELKLSRDLDDP